MKTQQNTIKWLNLFLLVINISAFITILFMNRNTVSGDSRDSSYTSDMFLKDELKLDDEQYAKLAKLDGDVFRSYQVLLDKQCELNFGLLEELSAENPSKANLDSIAERIGHFQTLIKKQTIRHFTNIRSLCNPEQEVLLDKLLQEMMEVGDQCKYCNKKDCERRNSISK